MKKIRIVQIVFVFAVGAFLTYKVINAPELAQKPEWATLQSVEFSHRDKVGIKMPLLMQNALGSGFDIVGFASGDKKFPYVWIMLNPATENPVVKIMPNSVSFNVDCNYVRNLQKKIIIDKRVLKYFSAQCVKEDVQNFVSV